MSCYNAIVLLSMYFLFSSSNSRATYFPHLEHIQLTITRWVKATFLFPLITWYVLISCTGWHFGRPQLPTLCRHWKDDFLHIATTPDAVKILRFTHLLSLGMWLGKDKSGSMKVARRRRHTVAVDKPFIVDIPFSFPWVCGSNYPKVKKIQLSGRENSPLENWMLLSSAKSMTV